MTHRRGGRAGVDIFQPLLPAYRTDLFNRLAERMEGEVRFFADKPSGSAVTTDGWHALTSPIVRARTYKIGPIWFVPRALLASVTARDRVLVLSGNLRQVELLPVLLLTRLAGRKTVVWFQGVDSLSGRTKRLLRRISSALASGLVVYSEAGKRELATVVSAAKIYVVDNTTGRPAPGPESAMHELERAVCYVGRLDPRKHVHQIIEAIAFLREQGHTLKLEVVGGGSETGSLKAQIAELGLGTLVTLHGPLTDWSDVNAVISGTDVVIAHSAAGLAVIDAMASARGVIVCSKDPGNGPEWRAVDHLWSGYIMQEQGAKALAQALLELYDDPTTLPRLGHNAGVLYRERFTLDQAVDALLHAIDSV